MELQEQSEERARKERSVARARARKEGDKSSEMMDRFDWSSQSLPFLQRSGWFSIILAASD